MRIAKCVPQQGIRYTPQPFAQALYERKEMFKDSYGEDNDCTVVALSIAAGIPYNVAHDILRAAGRERCKGFRLVGWLRCQYRDGRSVCGYKVTPVNAGWKTLAQVRRDFPKGRFILRKRGHVFAMIDNEVMDYGTGNRTRITDLFLFERG